MIKQFIKVPKDIRYISDWAKLKNEPFKFIEEPHILDKGLTGCGFTQYCITNDENVILCSPRKMLLENKEKQHPGVFYIRNEFDKSLGVDRDLTTPTRKRYVPDEIPDPEIVKKYYSKLRLDLVNYIQSRKFNEPIKILVTYDSFRIVKEVISSLGILNNFRIIIDEFQSIFTDSKFKSGTELEFVYHLQGIDKVCFVSATPMMDEYLEELPEFAKLPYYVMDWKALDPMRTLKPLLDVHPASRGINTPAVDIVNRYLSGKFEKAIIKDNNGNSKEIESKEAVFYVNSVKNICDIIRKAELNPGQVNILCANTPQNQDKINISLRPLGHKRDSYLIGTVPIKGEPHKMFTFCTRTVYLGADFYSTCARSFILSDASIECLAVDITLDLPQIMGRQRLDNNPWKNRATMYVKTLTANNRIPQSVFDEFVAKKTSTTNDLLQASAEGSTPSIKHSLAHKYLKDIRYSVYKDDYVAVNQHTGKGLDPVFNNLVKLAERRAFDIQQLDYVDRFSVINAISKMTEIKVDSKVPEFLEDFNKDNDFPRKMKLLCDNYNSFISTELTVIFNQIPVEYHKYVTVLGIEKIKASCYFKYKCEEYYSKAKFTVIDKDSNERKLGILIYQEFKEGDRFTLIEAKEKLKPIYEKVNHPYQPSASDLNIFFNCRKTRKTIKDDKGNKVVRDAIKLVKKLK